MPLLSKKPASSQTFPDLGIPKRVNSSGRWYKTIQARLWAYVRDDRPFGGTDPPAAVYAFSRDRGGAHPARHLAHYGGRLQGHAQARVAWPAWPDNAPRALRPTSALAPAL